MDKKDSFDHALNSGLKGLRGLEAATAPIASNHRPITMMGPLCLAVCIPFGIATVILSSAVSIITSGVVELGGVQLVVRGYIFAVLGVFPSIFNGP